MHSGCVVLCFYLSSIVRRPLEGERKRKIPPRKIIPFAQLCCLQHVLGSSCCVVVGDQCSRQVVQHVTVCGGQRKTLQFRAQLGVQQVLLFLLRVASALSLLRTPYLT